MVIFTICTYWFAPAAPFVSGGTKAKPNILRVSCALWPSKFTPAVTPCNPTVSCCATGSDFPLLRGSRVARGSGISWEDSGVLLPFHQAMFRSGAETSCRAAVSTDGLAAWTGWEKNTRVNRNKTVEIVRFIGPPGRDTRMRKQRRRHLSPVRESRQQTRDLGSRRF